MNHDEHPPRRHLHPVEPPYDPEHDQPGRRPAQNNDAEQAVLGALLTAPHLAADLETHLDADDFYRPAHEQIWTAIHTVAHTDGIEPDILTVAAHLQRNGDLVKVGGAPYLHTLMQACPIPGQAPHYAQLVRDTARLRRLQETTTRLQGIVNTGRLDDLEQTFTRVYEELDTAAARLGPTTPADTATTTGLHDLAWILTGTPPSSPPPEFVHRTDDTALFYRGRVNGLFGDPESGKTWLAQMAIVEALNTGGTAAMIDVDHNGPDHTAARLLLLGAHLNHIADPDRFRYYEPDDADQLRAAITDITTRAPDVLVLDSIGEMLPMLGVKSVDNDEITAAMRTIAMPPAKAGCCVITVDHLPKSAEARVTGYAIGGTAKKRAIDGAYLRVEAKVKPTPGGIGRITLRIEKDRTGELRKTSGGGYAGTLTLDSTQPHITRWSIGREDSPITTDGKFRPTHLMEAVSRFIEDNDQCSFRDVKDAVTGQDKNLRTAIKLLVDEGFVSTMPGPRNSLLHHSIALYRETEDDNA